MYKIILVFLMLHGLTHGGPFDKGGFKEKEKHSQAVAILKIEGGNIWYTAQISSQTRGGINYTRRIYNLILCPPDTEEERYGLEHGIQLISLPAIYNELLEFKVIDQELTILFKKSEKVYLKLNLDTLKKLKNENKAKE